jgi:hypothetical protein
MKMLHRDGWRTASIPFVCGLLSAMLTLAGCGSSTEVDRAASVITPGNVRTEINYIASDALKGRNTPSPGLDSAGAYIARLFARSGLRPVNGSYYQPFNLSIVALGDSNRLDVQNRDGWEQYELKDEFVPFEMTADREVEGDVVFAGYGISAPEYHYDDYAGLDVRGKIVLVLRHEPGEEDSSSVFQGKRATGYSTVQSKVKQAREHGAIGVLVVTDPLNHSNVNPRGFPWPSLSKFLPKDALPLTLGVDEKDKLPVVHVGERFMTRCFGSVDSLKSLQKAMDAKVTPHSFGLPGVRVRLRTSTAIRQLGTQNIVGLVEGADPALLGEVVVVGAHYDHVGVKANVPAGADSIYNGADDNGSGTVALMEVARALGAMKAPPARTVLLVAFAGEEKGLFGSEYYVRHPLLPIDSTVAMLNMDMVGRNSPDSLLIIGAPEESFLAKITRAENAGVGFTLVNTQIVSGGSDHQSFQTRMVPVIFYHSDLHPDYHQVSDEAPLINEQKLARVAQLVFRTAWNVATTHDSRILPLPRGKQ